MQMLDDFERELGTVQEVQDPAYFLNLSARISSLQDDFKKAGGAYDDFKSSLKEVAVKPLEDDSPIPNGGKCHFCLSLRT
jgi:hypothetical protein